jgi:alpha-L-rhamnosidase
MGAVGRLVMLAMALLISQRLAGQTAAPSQRQAWRAQWITDPVAPGQAAGVYHFRRDFDLASKPERFVVQVSADNRYRLFVNGIEVSNGPARGDLLHWRYESVDIAPQLRAGRNVLAALVWNFGEVRPAAQVTHRTAFLLQGESGIESLVDTGPEWKVLRNPAYSFSPIVGDDSGGYYVAGPNEAIDAKLYPWDWDLADLDTSSWAAVKPLGPAQSRGSSPFGLAIDWQLVPRNIPLPEQRLVRFAEVRRTSGIKASTSFLRGDGDLVIPSNSRVMLLIDNRVLTLGYPVLVTSGGSGASAMMTYAEALFDAEGHKGNRNEIDGKTIRGVKDSFRFDGGADRHFQSLWLRAFRYVQMDIETGAEPLRIHDFHSIFAAYPFVQRASFASDAAWIEPIWDLDWRALRLSAFETFWDTPYYEQLQYVGDTRIESLLSIYLTGDDRLMRNAIEQFDDSRIPEGITRSSYPSSTPQLIPPFSLWWIAMVHDYWMLRDDPAFVRGFLPGIRGVLAWYERHLDESGMLGAMPWWNFVDWSFERGVPPDADTGHSTAITFQYVLALRCAADLEEALGRSSDASHDRTLAERLVAALRVRAWNEQRSLFADSAERKAFSQQTNALAVLAGAVPSDQRRAVMERVVSDGSLVQASYYFRFYVDEAMREAGLGDRYLERLEPWREMIRNGLTATAETPDPSRSDSHAWSAHPNYHLLATVLGIRPGAPGFRSILVVPALGSLRSASGQVPHAGGPIRVQLQRVGPAGVDARIELPVGFPGEFRWRDQAVPLRSGTNHVRCQKTCGRYAAASGEWK